MRKYQLNIFWMIVLTLASFSLQAQVEKSKDVDKSYQVSNSTVLAIKNKFGKIHINTWDKNQIDVKVNVTVKARNDDKAQDLLDRIKIDVSESAGRKSFETNFGKNFNSKNNEEFTITYEVSMPASNPIEIKNSFGNTYLGDHSGDAELSIAYGDIKGGNLTGTVDLRLSFGNGDLDEVSSGEMTIKYSKLEVEQMGDIDLTQQFSDLEIGNAGSVDLSSKYGSLEFDEVTSIDGSAGFTGFEIGRLNKKLILKASYVSGFSIDELSRDFEYVDIEGRFGGYRIKLEDGAEPTVEGEFSFSSMKYDKEEIVMNYVEKDMNKAKYKGKVGSGQKGKITIDSSYGDLRIGF